MTDLLELACRVEAADGPDRELDYAIHEAIHGEWLRRNAYTREPGDDGWASPTPPVKGANFIAGPQAYTSSLDAAMTLVPEGWGCACGNGVPDEKPWAWCAEPGEVDVVHAATPALALTAACLKAMAGRV